MVTTSRFFTAVAVTLVVAGCSSGNATCVPGASSACVCPGGGAGAQVCLADGTYGACDCSSPDTDAAAPRDDGGLDAGGDAEADASLAMDAGIDAAADGGPVPCASDSECDDGAFCNGAERCDPSAATANASGCVAGTRACVGMACVEATDSCASCATMGDIDADGHRSRSCGGDDCDDEDADVHPGATDACNGADDDCDGTIDDEPLASALCPSGRSCVAGACSVGVTTTEIAFGSVSSCALLGDGTVLCAGSSMHGTLGDGSTTDRPTHVMPSGLDDVVDVLCANEYCCAIAADETVSCWGRNSGMVFQSPDSALTYRSPTMLASPTDAVSGAPQTFYACTLDAAGHVRCWGVSTPWLGFRLTPTEVGIPSRVVALGLGGNAGCALQEGGEIVCWGSDANLAPGVSGPPTTLAGVSGARSIAVANSSGCALLADGTVTCWGSNDSGQLGRTASTWPQPPTAVPGLDRVVQLSAGAAHLCALRDTGEVLCWGGNMFGQVGNGTHANVYAPTVVDGLPSADAVWAGGPASNSTCAHTATGVLCWGDDRYGQLGDGATGLDYVAPVLVTGLP